MVCIAAFIILALIGVFVAIISIFKPKVGKAYLRMFKKAWGCLWKKVRLQKCETGFKEDVKNTILSRVIVKHPKWVKPLSIIIEILSVIIVIVAVSTDVRNGNVVQINFIGSYTLINNVAAFTDAIIESILLSES